MDGNSTLRNSVTLHKRRSTKRNTLANPLHAPVPVKFMQTLWTRFEAYERQTISHRGKIYMGRPYYKIFAGKTCTPLRKFLGPLPPSPLSSLLLCKRVTRNVISCARTLRARQRSRDLRTLLSIIVTIMSLDVIIFVIRRERRREKEEEEREKKRTCAVR